MYVNQCIKVAEDDIAFKLAILKKSLHLNDNTCFCSIIQSSKLVLGSLLAKNNFFVQFWTKIFASSRMANCGSGLPAEWPFRSQNAIEASDSPLPGGLWVKRLIMHALCSLAYSDIAWCKLFLIFTMKCLYWVFLPTKHHIVYWLIIPSISKKLTLKKLGWHFRAKFLDASNIYQFRNWNTFISYRSNIFDNGSHWGPGKFVTFHWRLFKIHVLLYQSDSYPKFPRAPVY